ncbi:MAG: V-type ATPase subunit [Bacteroides sp.]|nr:V-type ATPase subunit [Bacteroides sp.]
MNQKVKLEDTVILIDTVFYNFLVTDIKNHFEKQLNRALEVIDLPTLTTYLSLDMGLCAGDNTVQLLWLYTKQISDLQFTKPSSLKSDLDGKAFQNEVGEFLMASVSTEDLVPIGELYVEVLQMALESENVKKIALIADYSSYKDMLNKVLSDNKGKLKEKEVVFFNMGEVQKMENVRKEILVYPLMQALGIKADDLKE